MKTNNYIMWIQSWSNAHATNQKSLNSGVWLKGSGGECAGGGGEKRYHCRLAVYCAAFASRSWYSEKGDCVIIIMPFTFFAGAIKLREENGRIYKECLLVVF